MATTKCAPIGQSPSSQGAKPCNSNRRRKAPNWYGVGVMITAVTQADDGNKVEKELFAQTAEFQKPKEW